MMNTELINLCLELSIKAHKGQIDKVGLPVVLHPLHVGYMGDTTEEVCVGFLHDTLEDTSLTSEDLTTAGVPQSIVNAVEILTHDKVNYSYEEYIERIIQSGDRTAIKVKWYDLHHNYERSLKYGFSKQNEKCRKAIERMSSALNL